MLTKHFLGLLVAIGLHTFADGQTLEFNWKDTKTPNSKPISIGTTEMHKASPFTDLVEWAVENELAVGFREGGWDLGEVSNEKKNGFVRISNSFVLSIKRENKNDFDFVSFDYRWPKKVPSNVRFRIRSWKNNTHSQWYVLEPSFQTGEWITYLLKENKDIDPDDFRGIRLLEFTGHSYTAHFDNFRTR